MQRFHYPTIDSTNVEAKRLYADGQTAPFIVVADTQTSGKGTRDRSWHSDLGGLYCSAFLDPNPILEDGSQHVFQAKDLAALHIKLAVHLQQTVYAISGIQCIVKWPNDLLIQEKKVAGILMASSTTSVGVLDYVIVGIGLNLNQTQFQGLPATSLQQETGRCYNRDSVLDALIPKLQTLFLP